MRLKISLAQKLTFSIALAVAVQAIFVFGSYLYRFEPQLSATTNDVIEAGVLANAQTYAARWNYEILVNADGLKKNQLDPALQKHIQNVLKTEPAVSGIAIFHLSSQTNDPQAKSGKKKKLIARKQRADAQFAVDLKKLGKMDKELTYIAGSNAYAGTPVKVEEDVIGYLLFARSIAAYHREMGMFRNGMTLTMVLFFIFQLIAIFLLGRRSGKPVTLLAKTTSQIAAGDLTQKVSPPRGAVTEIAELSNAILDMSTAIHQQVSLIKSLTAKASGVSNNLARTMTHLAGSASEQAAAVSQTATTVEQMESSGKSVVDAVKRIVEAADRSATVSGRGRTAVATASGVMVKIKEESANIATHSRTLLGNVEEVGNIINSVNAISEQSKILAVNASIEAAKAGEFGAGFAVVAQEVKNLAGQSKEATEQITHTLMSIRQSVEMMVRLSRAGEDRTKQGVESIANAGAIVNDLSEAIQEASEVANEIESSVNQQTTGLSQIASAMDEINISASENQEISHNMERSTGELTEALQELSLLVDVWTTTETTETTDTTDKSQSD